MKFDQTMLKALLQLDDAALWQKIREIAAGSGIHLSATPPPPEEMAKLRALAGGCGQAEAMEAVRTLSRYRQEKGGK